ncbi:MAG: response regulator, partial [Deltaproteobacteria bacterium]
MIRVLIVDDSPSAAQFLAHIISSDPEMEVVGIAGNGADGLRMAEKLRPDIISMDINMPIMDGFETTHRIMSSCP